MNPGIGVRRSLRALERLAKQKSLVSSAGQDINLHNNILSRWKSESFRDPKSTLQQPQTLQEAVLGVSSSDLNIQKLDPKSYSEVLKRAAKGVKPQKRRQDDGNDSDILFIDGLLHRMLTEAKTNYDIQLSTSDFAAVCQAWVDSGYDSDASSVCPSEKIEDWINTMHQLSDEGWPDLQPNIVLYNILLNAWSQEGMVEKMEQTIQRMVQMKTPGIVPDYISFSTLLAAYSKLGTVEAASKADLLLNQMIDLFENGMVLAKPNLISFTNAMLCHANLGDDNASQEWLDKLLKMYEHTKDPDWMPDIVAYNTVLLAKARSGQPEKVDDFLKHMYEGQTPVSPNERSFNIALSAWAQKGNAERAEAILMRMHELHVTRELQSQPDVVSYNTVLDAYAKMAPKSPKGGEKASKNDTLACRPWKRAITILNHMELVYREGRCEAVRPNERTWNSVLHVCANSGRVDEAENLLDQMSSKGHLTASVRTWNILLSACLVHGDIDRMKHLWQKMLNSGINPDIVSYNTYLTCFVRACRINSLKGKRRTFDGGRKPERIEAAVESLYRQIRQDPYVEPTKTTYMTVLNFWICTKKLDRAESFLFEAVGNLSKRSKNDNTTSCFAFDRDVFHTLMSAWSLEKEPRRAEAVLLTMADLAEKHNFDLRPTVDTYNSVLNAWALSKRVQSGERAEAILREMEALSKAGDDKVAPNIHSFNFVLDAWAESGDPTAVTKADSLILEMILKGDPELMPNSASYGAWLKAIFKCDRAEQERRVDEVEKTMKIHDFSPNRKISRWINRIRHHGDEQTKTTDDLYVGPGNMILQDRIKS